LNIIIQEDGIGLILRECEQGYPEEICGALLGSGDAGDRMILRVLPIRNERNEERQTRYLIGPAEFQAADASARADGLEIVGFYHSHPDHPAVPSAFDRDHAWPWYVYVIVPVQDGRAGRPRAWRLVEDRSRFEEIGIVQGAAEPASAKEAK
jgi:proteasome lid subunit RPN8/RPN11